MKIVIAGGSGFLGKILEKYFLSQGHEIFILTRNPVSNNQIYWDAKTTGDWSGVVEGADVLINLTGKSVDCRYNAKNKAEILASRLQSTKVLQQAIDLCEKPPRLWVNASSATIYIHAETQQMTEENGIIGDDFSMNICKQWEKAFFETPSPGIRKVALRTSIVLSDKGGALPKLKRIIKLGLGDKQGRGHQMVSWIHEHDFCRAVDFVMHESSLEGPVNVTAPTPIPNWKFMQVLRKKWKVPFGLSTPVFLLEIGTILMRTESELLLKSRNVIPEKLLKAGFTFNYKSIEDL